jgi:hypothetical protein
MKTSLLLLLVMLLAACGRQERRLTIKRTSVSPGDVERILLLQSFSCEAEDCITGVGRVLTVDLEGQRSGSLCTAFLVSEDLALTNTHCVYMGTADARRTCDGVFFAFPGSAGFETAKCSQILWRNLRHRGERRASLSDQDFALSISPLKINRSGTTSGARVTPLVMDQISNYDGRLLRLDCTVDWVNSAGVIQLQNCPAISGNSGSPVLDQNGEVVAIMYASADPKVHLPTYSREERRKGKALAYALNMPQLLIVIEQFL